MDLGTHSLPIIPGKALSPLTMRFLLESGSDGIWRVVSSKLGIEG